jgi:thiol-disulfide isomerase/thioredoxin
MAKNQRNIFIGLGLVVVIAAIFAVLASGGSDNSSSTTTTFPSGNGSVAAAEFQPVAVTGTALARLGDGQTDASKGAPGPVLKGYSLTGLPVNVNPATDGPTMLVFLAHWCPHCNREIPRLIDWKEQGLVPDNLRVVGITTGSRNDQANWPPSEWIETMKWPFEVMADSETQQAAAAYGVDGYPFMVILDAQGNVAKRTSGEVEVADLVSIIDAAIGKS